MLLHELGQDFVLALDLGLELLDLLLLGVRSGFRLPAVFEGQMGILEEQPLPRVE